MSEVGTLVLTRKPGQEIKIGDEITIKILEGSTGGIIRVGIQAPKDISVHRLEIWDKIQAEKKLVSKINKKVREVLNLK